MLDVFSIPPQEREQLYLVALIDALRPRGRVLEIGFGRGDAATHIQTYHLDHHVIVEHDPKRAEEARGWAEKYPHVSILQDTWQNALPTLEVFDAIFFNASSSDSASDVMKYRDSGQQALDQAEKLSSLVAAKIPQLTSIRYSDQDIDTFYQQEGQLHREQLPHFFYELKTREQISEEQYEGMIQKYHLEKNEVLKTPCVGKYTPDPAFVFFQACLDKQMVLGSRFSCFSSLPTSKYEDPEFFEQVITNPHLDYQESWLPVTTPGCPEALIMVIEKLS